MLEDLEPPVNRLKTCKIAVILATLEPKDQRILVSALADTDKWANLSLSRALKSKGLDLSDNTIAKHRRGDCRCAK
jgi:hypothetical protein